MKESGTPYTFMKDAQVQEDYPNLFLTVIGAFLYVGNLYLFAVSSKDYSEALGIQESFSGILTGVNWIAAVLCAFLYSYWSNYQFKVPTAVCAGLAFMGNFLYFLAFDANSGLLLVLGRILMGVGRPRVINRRYITTYVSLSVRTKWNTFYAAGSILGMAFGPLAFSGFYYFRGSLFGLSVTHFNSCALIMSAIWLAYLIGVVVFFTEPEVYHESPEKFLGQNSEQRSLVPTAVALWALFFPKLLQESLIISSPIVTGTLFGWSSEFLGIYLAITLLAVSPIHILIAYTSKYVQDRQFLLIAFFFCVLGSFLLIGYGDLPVWQYVLGSVVVHLAINLSDGVSTSLTSKVLPPEIGRGFFNPGLLSTFAGSSGRAFGSSLIFVCGYLGTNQTMENSLFVPIGLLSVVSLLVFMASYKNLVPLKKG